MNDSQLAAVFSLHRAERYLTTAKASRRGQATNSGRHHVIAS